MAMEKSSSKYRTQFWYVAMASFLLWLVLLYLFNSSAKTVHNHERLFRQENIIDLPVETVPQNHESDEAPVVVSEEISVDNSSLPVSVDSSPVDQMSEDKKVVTDLVEELEKERVENEKKRGDSVIIGRSSRAKRGHRESRKARSSGRLEADKKRVRHNNDDDETNVENSDDNDHQSFDKEPNFFESKNNVEPKKEQVDDNDDDLESKRGNELENDGSNNDLQDENITEIVSKPKTQRNYASNSTTSKAKNRVNSKRNQPRRDQKVMIRPIETRRNDPCKGKYVYMHEVPALFNEELLKNCWTLSRWTDMCELTSNFGLGPRLPNMEGVSGWYATNQFTLEVIFHNRMKQYKCLTKDSSLASAVYVPYYPGLDLMRFLWGPFPSMRDAAALDLMKWLRESPEWKRMDGRDHFMVAGRTTWDFMRTPENESDWGNRYVTILFDD